MLARIYQHKEFVCKCNPNFSEGDQHMTDEEGSRVSCWDNLPNHKDPRNEWSDITARMVDHHCHYCNSPMTPNPLSGQIEIIKNGKRGSWQTNKPKSTRDQE